MSAPRVAAVIPALNEARSIRAVAEAARVHVARVIVVDDGSTDGTRAALDGLDVEVLVHAERRGKGESLRDGFAAALAAGMDAAVSLDGDGQHDPGDIPRMLAAHRAHPRALILCSRSIDRARQPGLRRFANHFADFWVSWACGQRVLDSQCGQRLYPRVLLETLPRVSSGGFAFESEVLIEAARRGFPIVSLPIAARYPEDRRPSHFRPALDVWRITRMIFWKIVRRGLYLNGLWRAYTRPAPVADAPATAPR